MTKTLLCILFISVLLPSCSIPLGSVPIAFGGSWQLEPGLFVTMTPSEDGSLTIDLEGEGVIDDDIVVKDGGVEYVSPETGIRYRIEPDRSGGKPRFAIIGPGIPEAINPETISNEK